jgi:hypothetical protein
MMHGDDSAMLLLKKERGANEKRKNKGESVLRSLYLCKNICFHMQDVSQKVIGTGL